MRAYDPPHCCRLCKHLNECPESEKCPYANAENRDDKCPYYNYCEGWCSRFEPRD